MDIDQYYQRIQHETYRLIKQNILAPQIVLHVRRTFKSSHARFWILLPQVISSTESILISARRLRMICILQALGWTKYRIYDEIVDRDETALVPLFSAISRLFYQTLYDLSGSIHISRMLERQDEDFLKQTEGSEVTLLGLELLAPKKRPIQTIFKNYTRIRKIHDDVFDHLEDGTTISFESVISQIRWCIARCDEASMNVSDKTKAYVDTLLHPFKSHLETVTQILHAHQHAEQHR